MSPDHLNHPEAAVTDPTAIGERLSRPAAVNRRRLLVGGGAAAMAAALAGCGDDDDSGAGGTPLDGASSDGNDMAGDLMIAELAAGLEVLAVGTYKAALEAATAGKLGAVPPVVSEYVKVAHSQHQVHLDEWNKVVEAAGKPKVTEPNATLKGTVDDEFAKVKDAAGAANLALMLEDIAAQTYLSAIGALKSKDAIMLAGQIQIVDQQHQAILRFALGMYPVPSIFQSTDKAATA